MIIEFTDPGYNWGFLWWPVAILVIGIVATVVVWQFIESAAAPLIIIPLLIAIFGPVTGGMEYSKRVSHQAEQGLTGQGFSDVDVAGDRFTAATEDGRYFRGVLVDLEPESGYAYQVLELTGTEK